MQIFKNKRLAAITLVYWFFLLYIIAALVWWYIALQRQNNIMTDLLINELRHDEPDYFKKVSVILDEKRRKTAQYVGEGIFFLALIALGAVFVYRIIRKRLKLSMQQQNFMMAVTHELKTPIAIVKLNLETLQKRKLDEQQQSRFFQTTLHEVNRLNSLCNNILLASQLDAGAYKASKSLVDLSAVADKVTVELKRRYPNRRIESNIEDNIRLMGEETLLELLISNLLENAIKYSPPDGQVAILLIKKGRNIIIEVADEGYGIDEEEKEKIFEKFYRIGNEVTRSAKGTGLGLFLSKEIAKDHHGQITVNNNGQKGSIFTVTFKDD